MGRIAARTAIVCVKLWPSKESREVWDVGKMMKIPEAVQQYHLGFSCLRSWYMLRMQGI
jgi:hypothetical protein